MNNPNARKTAELGMIVRLGVAIKQWCGRQIRGLRPEARNQLDSDGKKLKKKPTLSVCGRITVK